MANPDCDICQGREVVRLPVQRPLRAVDVNEPPKVEESWRAFPCPQCAGMVHDDYVATLHCRDEVPAEPYDVEPGLKEHVLRKHGHGIVDNLIRGGFMNTREVFRRPSPRHGEEVGIQSTVGVVSKARVASIEQRAVRAAEEIVNEAIEGGLKQMHNWGSYYQRESIGKAEADRLIREGVRRAMDIHKERVGLNGRDGADEKAAGGGAAPGRRG